MTFHKCTFREDANDNPPPTALFLVPSSSTFQFLKVRGIVGITIVNFLYCSEDNKVLEHPRLSSPSIHIYKGQCVREKGYQIRKFSSHGSCPSSTSGGDL